MNDSTKIGTVTLKCKEHGELFKMPYNEYIERLNDFRIPLFCYRCKKNLITEVNKK